MMSMYNQTWIGRTLVVSDSTDPTLVGRQGTVYDETMKTITIRANDTFVCLNKSAMTFTIDGQSSIKGALVNQRPEDRIHRIYKGA